MVKKKELNSLGTHKNSKVYSFHKIAKIDNGKLTNSCSQLENSKHLSQLLIGQANKFVKMWEDLNSTSLRGHI